MQPATYVNVEPEPPIDRTLQGLRKLLISDASLRADFSGFGISEDDSGVQSLMALCRISPDSIDFPGLLTRVDSLEGLGGDIPPLDWSLLETGPIVSAARPALGGDSIGLRGGPSGTLGCLVENSTQEAFFLSCNHVIANCNGAPIGSTVDHPAYSGNQLGFLHDFETIRFGGIIGNAMDAAIGKPLTGTVHRGLRSGTALAATENLNPGYNSQVEKEGDATGRTTGKLTIKKLSILVDLCGKSALFDDQYGVIGAPGGFWGALAQPAFAKAGDSGAVVTLDTHVIGLLFAISTRVDLAYVNPIGGILTRFGVKIG